MPLYARLAAESAGVAGVLGDFHFLHLFAKGGAVSAGFFFQVRCCVREKVVGVGGWMDLVPYLPVTPTSVVLLLASSRRFGGSGCCTLCALRHGGGLVCGEEVWLMFDGAFECEDDAEIRGGC